ncbi:MAG TPA: thioredoxin family protein [Thermoanaerobaculia bacterium]
MPHPIVSHEEWIAARTAFLAKEKEFTRQRDELSRQRRELPWERVEKEYVFDGPNGKVSLSDLFGKHSQLIVYHFMFPPEWEAGCPHCSFWADNFNEIIPHLNQRDAAMVAISRAPRERLDAFEKRMGWSFQWLSSGSNDFNYDFGASFTEDESKKRVYNYGTIAPGRTDREGMSVFYKNEQGEIFHTYSSYARGIDMFNTAYHYLDACPKGRDEDKLAFVQAWVKHHDRYEQ